MASGGPGPFRKALQLTSCYYGDGFDKKIPVQAAPEFFAFLKSTVYGMQKVDNRI